ncbi:MAG: nickel pincer cofactor biosynthesis protein LarB [Acidimicrobiia bacterium]|nr:nickel pincer cofactor biosynthesis protein LarB [Acidimicrobiia bacterium]
MDAESRLDLDRSHRIDLPEAVYCQSKTVEQTLSILRELLAGEGPGDAVIATRVTPEQQQALIGLQPSATATSGTLSTLSWRHRPPTGATAAVVAAGTSDLAVAGECRLTLEALGHQVTALTDVGVAGLHRLLGVLPELEPVDVIVAIAGMEGALPTVLAGLVAQPIVAVPTSVGYGTAFEGQTALLSMMTSCAPGIAVVGIDNGYGAACAAHRILRRMTTSKHQEIRS